MNMSVKIYTDGGSRGNPGPSAFAVVVCRDGKIIHRHSEYMGVNTNNAAEYRGLIYAIGHALDAGYDDVEFITDSKLVAEQMNGRYKVKARGLLAMYEDALAMSSNIAGVRFTHVRRSDPMIAVADALLNRKMDEHLSREK